MKALHKVNPRVFPSFSELAKDKGAIGQVLRRLPRRVLTEARKKDDPFGWLAEYGRKAKEALRVIPVQKAKPACDQLLKHGWKKIAIGTYRPPNLALGVREIRFYNHVSDRAKACMRLILDTPNLSDKDCVVFDAASSQKNGFRQLAGMTMGVATANTDWRDELKIAAKSRNRRKLHHTQHKVFSAYWPFAHFQAYLRNSKLSPKVRGEIQLRGKKADKELIKRGKRDVVQRPKPLPGNAELRNLRVPFFLCLWWVRCGTYGVPGFMFFRNQALTKLLNALNGFGGQSSVALAKLRQRLRLKPASEKSPYVWDVAVGRRKHEIIIKGTQRDGSLAFQFRGKILSNAKSV